MEPVTPDRLHDLRNMYVDLIDKIDDKLARQRCSHCHRLLVRDRDFDIPGSLMDFLCCGVCPPCFTRTYEQTD
jgi:hypothetical protein